MRNGTAAAIPRGCAASTYRWRRASSRWSTSGRRCALPAPTAPPGAMGTFRLAVLIRHLQAWAPLLFLASLAIYAVWPWLPFAARAAPTRTLVVYGFSILGDTVDNAVFPAFQQQWQAQTGERVELI